MYTTSIHCSLKYEITMGFMFRIIRCQESLTNIECNREIIMKYGD